MDTNANATAQALPDGQGLTVRRAISAEDSARRREAVDYSRASVRLEGFVLTPFAEDLNRRYIAGEITDDEQTALLLAHYGL